MNLNQLPGELDIRIKKGDTFNKLITIADTDLSLYELTAGIVFRGRTTPLTITEDDYLVGKFYISIDDTSDIPESDATWFVEWKVGDVIRTILFGKFEAI